MTRINIIAWHNGGGLSRDVDNLVDALPNDSFQVHLNGIPLSEARRHARRIGHRTANRQQLLFNRQKLKAASYDVNVFLEDIWPGFFPFARANTFIPNPEWFKQSQRRHLRGIDVVLCKTRVAQKIFDTLGCNTRFISFTCEDRLDPTGATPTQEGFLHLAGRSWQKGTPALTDVWLRHPEWPVLRVVQSAKTYAHTKVKPITAPNIEHILERLDDQHLRTLQNAHIYHLCPSEAEGFGHCIAESMSCRALTLTTNAPPMNELITPERGVLVDFDRIRRQRSGHNYYVNRSKLEQSIQDIIDMDPAAVQRLGRNARGWYEDNDREFRELLIDSLQNI